MNALSYTTRSITGREGEGILVHHKILGKHFSKIDWLTNTNSSRLNKIFNQATGKPGKSLNLFEDWYLSSYKNFQDWEEVYKSLDVSSLQDYKSLIIIGGIDLHRSNLTRFGKRAGKFPKDSGQMSFQSHAQHLYNILALLKAHKTYGIPLHEIAYDPNEMAVGLFHDDYKPNSNYYLYHGYDIPKYGIHRCDSAQAYIESNDELPWLKEEKTIDFAFGYTVLEKSDREKFISNIGEIAHSFSNSKIFVKNDAKGINTLIPRTAYVDVIKRSRFTYMLPSYDQHCFSIYRWIESIYSDCLPILNSHCNIKDVEESFGVSLDELIENHSITEKRRLELLEHYKDKFSYKYGFIEK